LFHCFQWSGDEDERKVKFAAYWDVLQGRDPRFTIEACEYAAKGKLGDCRFLPTAAELFQAAEAFAAREVAQRKPRLSSSEPPQNDAITRQRIIAGFKKLLADLKSGNPIDPDKATRDVFRPAPETPPVISDALRAKLRAASTREET
jgi:hypothetical protein